MKIYEWTSDTSLEDAKNGAYWERNMLALRFAEGWYNDDISAPNRENEENKIPRFEGWRRVLSLRKGSITFHIPDDFNVGNLPQINENWDGHTTKEKWERILNLRGIKCKKF